MEFIYNDCGITEGRWTVMSEMRCQSCGFRMRNDPFNSGYYCPVCGIEPQDKRPVLKPFEMEFDVKALQKEPSAPADVCREAQALLEEEKYDELLGILSGLKKEGQADSKVILLSLLCGYRVKSTDELLKKISTGPMSVMTFLSHPDLDNLMESQLAKDNMFVVHIIEYFSISMILSGKDLAMLQKKLKERHGKAVRKESTLKGIDEEDEKNFNRATKISDAVRPPEPGIGDYIDDFLHTPPNMPENMYVSDSPAVNMALDIFEFITADGDDIVMGGLFGFYKPMMRTRQYNYLLSTRPEKMNYKINPGSKSGKEAEEDGKKKITLCKGMDMLTPEELAVQKEKLLYQIIREEKLILA